jgi:hypothetical protein
MTPSSLESATLGKQSTMRLDARSHSMAIREAEAYLGIGEDHCDEAGDRWELE